MNWLQAIILSVIEGITEFLPVSSTGHMVLASSFMGIETNAFVKLFTVVIQLGCILSVFAIYFKRFFKSINFYFKLIAGTIPAAILGLLLKKHIDAALENPLGVAIILVVGGIVLLFVDQLFNKGTKENEDDLTLFEAFKIGCFQAVSIFPGVSRSAATITGGMINNLTRGAAANFAFFLALPVMLGATLKDVKDYFDDGNTLSSEQIKLLAGGNVIAFIIGLVVIKYFVTFISKYGFKAFGYYRIGMGLLIIILLFCNVKMQAI